MTVRATSGLFRHKTIQPPCCEAGRLRVVSEKAARRNLTRQPSSPGVRHNSRKPGKPDGCELCCCTDRTCSVTARASGVMLCACEDASWISYALGLPFYFSIKVSSYRGPSRHPLYRRVFRRHFGQRQNWLYSQFHHPNRNADEPEGRAGCLP